MPARNTIEVVIKGDDQASGVIDGILGKVQQFGASVTRVGAGLTAATAPLTLALGAAVNNAVQFDEAMTNVGAVLGKNRDQMAALNAQVLKIGAGSRAGPQRAAEAFYDIVGGVADASSHMAILEASIKTAEAGSADLGATTNALIAIMNSYQFEAEEAAYASDVLARTVGMGVGTMEDFASAMPQVTGLANSLNISFGDLGGMMGYLTTQGNSASQAATQLSAMMTAMLNPNETMKKALKEMGFASGQAAIEQLGLVGAMNALADTQTAQEDGMAKMLGSVEALRGVTALAGATFGEFSTTFTDGITGATAAAQAIQLDSPAAQFDLLKSKIGALGTTIGTVVLPVLSDLMSHITPIVDAAMAWINANPHVAGTLLLVVGALIAAGPVLMLAGTAITAMGTAMGIVLAPAVLLAGAITAIVAAAQLGYPGGIVQLFNDAVQSAQQLAFLGLYVLAMASAALENAIRTLILQAIQIGTEIVNWSQQNAGLIVGITAFTLLLAQSSLGVKMWGLAVAAGNAISSVASLLYGAMTAGVGALSGMFAAATATAGGMGAALMAAIGPILLVGAAIAGVILQIREFQRVTEEGRKTAQAAAAQGLDSGKITKQDVYDQSFKSIAGEYGGGVVGDVAARLFYTNIANDTLAGRDSGGTGVPGSAYLIGRGAQPEAFIPTSPGMFIPNFDQVLAGAGAGGGGDINISTMNINANTYEGGRAAMHGALDAVKERQKARGG